jgi:hypothetical protein
LRVDPRAGHAHPHARRKRGPLVEEKLEVHALVGAEEEPALRREVFVIRDHDAQLSLDARNVRVGDVVGIAAVRDGTAAAGRDRQCRKGKGAAEKAGNRAKCFQHRIAPP